jgi:hypothetical protein
MRNMHIQIDDRIFEEYKEVFIRYTRQSILRRKLKGAVFGGVPVSPELHGKLSAMIEGDSEMMDLAESILKNLTDEYIKDHGHDLVLRRGDDELGHLYHSGLSGTGTEDDPVELIQLHHLGRAGEYYERSPKIDSG